MADPPGVGSRSAEEQDPQSPAAPVPAGSGPDLVRAALAQARAAARRRGVVPGEPARGLRRRPSLRSGPGADARDPILFGAAIRRMVEERGWQEMTAASRVLGDWERLVGHDIAEHCRPVSIEEGRLVLVAESSAWATQLRAMTRALRSRLEAQVGPGVVSSVVVHGPGTPDWRRGPRRVRGRGPRDTYG